MLETIAQTDPEDSYIQRRKDAVGFWELMTLNERIRDIHRDVPWHTFHADHDPVTDTIIDQFFTKYSVNSIRKEMGIDFDTWITKPRYLCDRDIKLVQLANQRKAEHLKNDSDLDDLVDT